MRRYYISRASEDYLPKARMTFEGVPSSAIRVALPARIDAPPNNFGKKRKKERVGIELEEVKKRQG